MSAAGGTVGTHPASGTQLFMITSGSGWVAGAGGDRVPLGPGWGVRWEQGDLQSSRRLLRRAATDLRRRLGPEHRWTVEARSALANMTEPGRQ